MAKGTRERKPGKVAKPARPKPRPEQTEDLLTGPLHGGLARPAAGAAPVGREGLGDRIRRAREMRGLSLDDVASRSGVRVDTLKRVESNETIPPLGELVRLGKALEMKMGYLISPGIEKPMTVVRAGARPTVSRQGKKPSEHYGYVFQSLAAQKANRVMEPFLVTMVPTDFEELSSHDGQEFLFVLEGEIQARVGKETETLRAGDAVYYDSATPHLVKCAGGKPAKILAVLYAGSK